jgi:hypothetical protein
VSIGEKSPYHSLTLETGEQTAQACANACCTSYRRSIWTWLCHGKGYCGNQVRAVGLADWNEKSVRTAADELVARGHKAFAATPLRSFYRTKLLQWLNDDTFRPGNGVGRSFRPVVRSRSDREDK